MSDRDTKDLLGPKGKGKRVSRDAPTERLRPVGSEPAPEFRSEHLCGGRPKKPRVQVRQIPPRGWVLRVEYPDGARPREMDVAISTCPFCGRDLEDQR